VQAMGPVAPTPRGSALRQMRQGELAWVAHGRGLTRTIRSSGLSKLAASSVPDALTLRNAVLTEDVGTCQTDRNIRRFLRCS